jgi:hypothetical protein
VTKTLLTIGVRGLCKKPKHSPIGGSKSALQVFLPLGMEGIFSEVTAFSMSSCENVGFVEVE